MARVGAVPQGVSDRYCFLCRSRLYSSTASDPTIIILVHLNRALNKATTHHIYVLVGTFIRLVLRVPKEYPFVFVSAPSAGGYICASCRTYEYMAVFELQTFFERRRKQNIRGLTVVLFRAGQNASSVSWPQAKTFEAPLAILLDTFASSYSVATKS